MNGNIMDALEQGILGHLNCQYTDMLRQNKRAFIQLNLGSYSAEQTPGVYCSLSRFSARLH